MHISRIESTFTPFLVYTLLEESARESLRTCSWSILTFVYPSFSLSIDIEPVVSLFTSLGLFRFCRVPSDGIRVGWHN